MKRLIVTFVMIIMLAPPVFAYEVPQLDGEDDFNEKVEQIMTGQLDLSPVNIINMFLEDMTREIKESGKDILLIIMVAAVSGIVTVLSNSFGNHAGSEAAFFACFSLMSMAAIQCFTTALTYGVQVIDAMNSFMTKLSPLLMIMLMLCGNAVSASAFHPVLSGAVYVISIVIRQCLVPLICFGSVLAVAGNISDKVQISNFCRVVKLVSKWLMAAIITIFTGISAIYGFSAPALDAVSAKTVKFAVGSLVPVVGTFLSDTLETVVSGSRLMKNAVGTSGIIIMCMICIVPVLKIGIIQLMLKITAAAAEPITDKRISQMLWEMSESVATIFGTVIMTVVLFMINLSIILAATSFGG